MYIVFITWLHWIYIIIMCCDRSAGDRWRQTLRVKVQALLNIIYRSYKYNVPSSYVTAHMVVYIYIYMGVTCDVISVYMYMYVYISHPSSLCVCILLHSYNFCTATFQLYVMFFPHMHVVLVSKCCLYKY